MKTSYDVCKDETDNVYVNLTISNANKTVISPVTGFVDTSPINASLSANKTVPILDNCCDYYCSVIRFSIPLNTIPLLICPIVPNQVSPNLTPLVFTIEYPANNFFIFPVTYLAENSLTAPVQNAQIQIITPYYYIYSYENFIEMANISMASAWIVSGLAALFPLLQAPYFYFDAITKLINLVVPACFVKLTAPAVDIPIIHMNAVSERYYSGYQTYFNGYNQANGLDYTFLFTEFADRVENIYNTSYYRFTQEYQTVFNWSSLQKIIITSPTIPVLQEYLPTSNAGNNSVTNSLPILTDFIPNIEEPGQSRSIAYYVPSGQYRLIDMTAERPLSNIVINIFWSDLQDNIYPLQIQIGETLSLKLAFLRKTLYKGGKRLLTGV